jgi:hydrogenase/urease accessory protein HupE
MRRLIQACLAMVCAFLFAAPTAAHEIRPAYLQIRQTPAGYAVLWKQPTQGDMAIRLIPHLSNGWLDTPPSGQTVSASFLIRTWTIATRRADALQGVTVSIEGLERTITDALVHVDLADGRRQDAILRPDTPSLRLDLSKPAGLPIWSYFRLGVTHILTGVDHLSFVLGLLLLVGPRWRLLKAITAFTAAHSITLALTAIGVIQPPSALIEALVALSILFLAVELVRARRGGDSLTIRHPWVIAFAFGLLHGCAFAGALAEVGLPASAVPQALVLFNLGVEAGQLLFVGAALAVGWMFSRLSARLPTRVLNLGRATPAYGIGSFAAFWVFERLAILIS